QRALVGSLGRWVVGSLGEEDPDDPTTQRPNDPPFRVRMALHTGDVQLEKGEYRGLVLDRAYRLLAAGHGGQILCSEVTASLLRRTLDPGLHLRELGVYRLPGFPDPERL